MIIHLVSGYYLGKSIFIDNIITILVFAQQNP